MKKEEVFSALPVTRVGIATHRVDKKKERKNLHMLKISRTKP